MRKKFTIEAELKIEAASQDGESQSIPKVSILAYTGGPLSVWAYREPVYVDLKGFDASKNVPIYRNHSSERIVGHGKAMIDGKNVILEGVLSGIDAEVSEVVSLSKKGFPWQASIGYQPTKIERVSEDQFAMVNGQKVQGPAFIARKGFLYEVSFVAVGADRNTEATIAASQQGGGGDPMDEDNKPDQSEKDSGVKQVPSVDAVFAEIKAEQSRQQEIAMAAKRAIEAGGDLEKIEKLTKLAIEGKQSPQAFELGLVREVMRYHGPAIHAGSSSGVDEGDLIEAALAQSVGGIDLDANYNERVLEAAHKRFPHGIKLGQLMRMAAKRNNYHIESSHPTKELLRAAFAPVQATGFSAYDLGGILTAVANKSILVAFNAVESTWRSIAKVGRVANFQTHTRYALTGAMQYEKVGNDGDLKSAVASKESYTNKADTYGKTFAITRTDLINDDLGAFDQVRSRLGRGAALAMNEVFWTEFLSNHTSFWTTGRANYFEGSTTVLSIGSLTTAEQMFFDQTDPDGKPLGLMPAILLVPNALFTTANVLMNSTEIRDTTSSTKYGTANPHAGKFSVVRSSYLSSSAMGGGYSSTGWYLLADPNDMAVIEMVFLNGVETPTVESADADFSQLGIQLRGYHDFGCNQQEYRAGVKSKGAA